MLAAPALFACLAATAVFMANAHGSEEPIHRTTFASFPMAFDGWRSINDPPMEEDILRALSTT